MHNSEDTYMYGTLCKYGTRYRYARNYIKHKILRMYNSCFFCSPGFSRIFPTVRTSRSTLCWTCARIPYMKHRILRYPTDLQIFSRQVFPALSRVCGPVDRRDAGPCARIPYMKHKLQIYRFFSHQVFPAFSRLCGPVD